MDFDKTEFDPAELCCECGGGEQGSDDGDNDEDGDEEEEQDEGEDEE